MAGYLKTISSFFTYKEKPNQERGFELLENKNEKTEAYKRPPSDDHPYKSIKDENTSESQKNVDTVSNELSINLETIKQKFGIPQNQDFIIREFKIGRKLKAFIVYIEEMVDKKTLNLSILPHLMAKDVLDDLFKEYAVDYLIENILTVHSLQKVKNYNQILKWISGGGR